MSVDWSNERALELVEEISKHVTSQANRRRIGTPRYERGTWNQCDAAITVRFRPWVFNSDTTMKTTTAFAHIPPCYSPLLSSRMQRYHVCFTSYTTTVRMKWRKFSSTSIGFTYAVCRREAVGALSPEICSECMEPVWSNVGQPSPHEYVRRLAQPLQSDGGQITPRHLYADFRN